MTYAAHAHRLPAWRRIGAAATLLLALAPGMAGAQDLIATETGIGSTPRPSLLGEPVTLRAAVRAERGGITGKVEFRDGSRTVGTAALLGAGRQGLDGGAFHSCAVNAQGGAMCWGWSAYGQLGIGPRENKRAPAQVVGLERGVVAVGTGDQHSCALTDQGAVLCWGDNRRGQLGDGTTDERRVPVQVIGLERGVRAIAVGARNTCALMEDATVRCWGNNDLGQLGDGTRTHRKTPVEVTGLPPVDALETGDNHSCARTLDGRLMCWGQGWGGRLGDGTEINRDVPVQVLRLSGVVRFAAGGSHTCAVIAGGAARCWGANGYGQLGTGDTEKRLVPARVARLASGVADIATGADHSCALMQDGTARCWGYNNQGQLGDNSTVNKLRPVNVRRISGLTAIGLGTRHSCALLQAGAMRCWGANFYGALGVGDRDARALPAAVVGGRMWPAGGRAVAVLVTDQLRRGLRVLTAAYSGSAMHAPSTSAPRNHRVLRD